MEYIEKVTPVRDLKAYSGFVQVQKRLIDAARNQRNKAFVTLLARGAIRISEATQLKVSDVNFTNGMGK